MHIIGLAPHEDQFIDSVDAFVSAQYPTGLESIMVELPPSWSDPHQRTYVEFFSEFIRRYESRGVRIIYGDTKRGLTKPEKIKKYQGILTKLECGLGHLVSWKEKLDLTWFIISTRVWDGLIKGSSRYRDRGMIQVIERENPQLIVVGGFHADYLKQRYPSARYSALVNIAWANKRRYKPKNTNEVINLP